MASSIVMLPTAAQRSAMAAGMGPLTADAAQRFLANQNIGYTDSYNWVDKLMQTNQFLSQSQRDAFSQNNNFTYNPSSSSSSNPSSSSSSFSGNSGVDIANTVFQGIGTIGNLGLGIAGAVETWKNNRTQRKLMEKQMQVAQEQINASQQARKERASELARLNRIRSNTNTQYNTASQVSRSY